MQAVIRAQMLAGSSPQEQTCKLLSVHNKTARTGCKLSAWRVCTHLKVSRVAGGVGWQAGGRAVAAAANHAGRVVAKETAAARRTPRRWRRRRRSPLILNSATPLDARVKASGLALVL